MLKNHHFVNFAMGMVSGAPVIIEILKLGCSCFFDSASSVFMKAMNEAGRRLVYRAEFDTKRNA